MKVDKELYKFKIYLEWIKRHLADVASFLLSNVRFIKPKDIMTINSKNKFLLMYNSITYCLMN